MRNKIEELKKMINMLGIVCYIGECGDCIHIDTKSLVSKRTRFSLFFGKDSSTECMIKYTETIILTDIEYLCRYTREANSDEEDIATTRCGFQNSGSFVLSFNFVKCDYPINGIKITDGELKGKSYSSKCDFGTRKLIDEYTIDHNANRVEVLDSNGCTKYVPLQHVTEVILGFSLNRLNSLYYNLCEL